MYSGASKNYKKKVKILYWGTALPYPYNYTLYLQLYTIHTWEALYRWLYAVWPRTNDIKSV